MVYLLKMGGFSIAMLNYQRVVDNFQDRFCGPLSVQSLPRATGLVFSLRTRRGPFFTQHLRWDTGEHAEISSISSPQSSTISWFSWRRKSGRPLYPIVSPAQRDGVSQLFHRGFSRSKWGERSLLPLNIDREAEEKDHQFFLGIFGENLRLEDKQMLVSHRPESRENLKILDTFVGLVLFCSWLMSILLKRLSQQLDAWIPFQGNLKKEPLPKLGSTHTWFEIRIFPHIKPVMVASLPVLSCHLG